MFSQTTGHAASPRQILESCRALKEHVQKIQDDASAAVKHWTEELQTRDLAEKRRVAPGWLDVGEGSRGLVPARIGVSQPVEGNANARQTPAQRAEESAEINDEEGEELDRAFGAMSMK
jgi:hypothetical protein